MNEISVKISSSFWSKYSYAFWWLLIIIKTEVEQEWKIPLSNIESTNNDENKSFSTWNQNQCLSTKFLFDFDSSISTDFNKQS